MLYSQMVGLENEPFIKLISHNKILIYLQSNFYVIQFQLFTNGFDTNTI